LQLADCEEIRGVVGWAPLIDPLVEQPLEELATHRKLKGIRHILQDEPDDRYMLRDDFHHGVDLLKHFGLVYDILIFARQLPQTIEFVDRHPQQPFVVDHVAKPQIREQVLSPWKEQMKELSKREQVYCKVSGMVTEADWQGWQEADLCPYFDAVLEAFGPRRLMFGSDWPVLLLGSNYVRWAEIVRNWTSSLSSEEQYAILAGTAIQVYSL
jgi:L-fuconolactonase